jgi:choice-of-anchor B domain-containing protein
MRKIAVAALALTISFSTFSQNYNLRFKSKMTFDRDVNDVWGVNHSNGSEYAIVGRVDGITVVDVSDPNNISAIKSITGFYSTWRDLKSFGNYAYGVTEAKEGITIINLTNAPVDVPSKVFNDGTWSSSHNFYIDESNGRMYIFGANFQPGKLGVLVYDLNNDPYNPEFVGVLDTPYCHDGFAKGNNLYLANINDGYFTIYDISNFASPQLLSSKSTPRFFTHNIWTNDSETVAFTTDEKSGAGISSYDISDKSNPIFLDNIESDPEIKPIVHNAHVKGDYVITSYYSNGITIHDASVPGKLAEVGYYDTSPMRNNKFNGAWGVFPFLNSGTVLVSDIEEGLIVLQPEYLQASVFDGEVVDKVSGVEVNNAKLVIKRGSHNVTNWLVSGVFNDRLAAGSYTFEVSAAGYVSKTVTVSSNNSVFPFTRIELEKSAVGIDDLEEDDLSVVLSGRTLEVSAGYEWDSMQLYASNGELIATADKRNGKWLVEAPTAGVYVLKAVGSSKLTTKKVFID